ncbi:MAG: aminotransferase class I/II-fold pyridoxal phosphate-dependent enzyme [bacterium]
MAVQPEIEKIIAAHPGPWAAIGLPQTKPRSAYVLGLIGLPGSGKSTLAKAIYHHRRDSFYIGGENVAYAMFGKDKCSGDEYQEVYRWVYQIMDAIAAAGYGVVFDSTNNLRVYRRQLASRIETIAKLRFVQLQAPEDTLINRLTQRAIDHSQPQAITSEFNPRTFTAFQNNFEPLAVSDGEKGIILDTQHTLIEQQLTAVDQLISSALDSPRPGNESLIPGGESLKPMIHFDWGHIRLDNLPVELFSKSLEQELAHTKSSLQYGEARGYEPLLITLAEILSHDLPDQIRRENLMITNGATQGLDIVVQAICSEGANRIACESPAFDTARHLLHLPLRGVDIVDIPITEDGLDVERLKLKLESGERIRAIYICPAMHNPTNVTYTEEVARALIALAQKFGFWIIEDGVYHPFLGQGLIPPESLYRLSGGQQVIYLGSFSKTIAPGLRIGFVLGDQKVINQTVLLNKFTQSSANRLAQGIVSQILKSPWFDQHNQESIAFLQHNRQILLNELETKAADVIDIFYPTIANRPGFYVWVRVRDINTQHLLPTALAHGVSFVPGDIYYFPSDGQGTDYLRLCVSQVRPEDIPEGVERLIKAIHAYRRDRGN